MASKKTNPIGIRLHITKNWNLTTFYTLNISKRDILIRKFLLYKFQILKVNLISYKINITRNNYHIYLNIFPLKQRLCRSKNPLNYYKKYF